MRICAPIITVAIFAAGFSSHAIAETVSVEGSTYTYESQPIEYGSDGTIYMEDSASVYLDKDDPYTTVEESVTVIEEPYMVSYETMEMAPESNVAVGSYDGEGSIMSEVIDGVVYETVIQPDATIASEGTVLTTY